MSVVGDAFVWLNDPLNWRGRAGILFLTYEHLYITVLSVLLAAVIALPLGAYLGHRRRGGGFMVGITNISRAVPTLALLTVFAVTPIGFGNRATILALALFAIPPLLVNVYVGVRGVDREVVDAARGMGLTEVDVLSRVELPLALPFIAAGFRTATVQVVATATLAALVGGGGLGAVISLGFGTADYGQVLAGGILVAALALAVEVAMAILQHKVTPAGSRRQRFRRPALVAPRG